MPRFQLYEDPKVHDALMRDVPIRRLGKPSDMAAAAAFLCSDDAAYVTGMLDGAGGGRKTVHKGLHTKCAPRGYRREPRRGRWNGGPLVRRPGIV
jgi:hypothetical protein